MVISEDKDHNQADDYDGQEHDDDDGEEDDVVEVEEEDDQHHQCSLATLGRSAVVLWHSAAPQRVFRTVNSIIAFEHHCTIFTVEHIPCAQLSTFAWENVPPPSYLSHEGSWGWLACLGVSPYHAMPCLGVSLVSGRRHHRHDHRHPVGWESVSRGQVGFPSTAPTS